MQGGQQFIRVGTVVFAMTLLTTLLFATDVRTSAHADSGPAAQSLASSSASVLSTTTSVGTISASSAVSSVSSWASSLYSITRGSGQTQDPQLGHAMAAEPGSPGSPGSNEPATGTEDLWNGVGDRLNQWVDARWRLVNGWTTYEWRTRPGAAASFWIGGGASRLRTFFSPDRIDHTPVRPVKRPTGRDARTGELRILGEVDFGVLAVPPVAGKKSSGYGYRIHPITRRRKFHKGVDYGARRGTPVQAAGPGIVTVAERRGTYGKLVIISHGLGLETRYAHLNKIKVEAGQFVPAGALIGLVGSTGRSTGPHLHFEVRQYGDPVDPHWAMARSSESITDELVGAMSWLSSDEADDRTKRQAKRQTKQQTGTLLAHKH